MNDKNKTKSFKINLSFLNNPEKAERVSFGVAKKRFNWFPLSFRFRAATIITLCLALVSWAAIPSYADTYGSNITEPYLTWLHVVVPGETLNEPVGIFSMPDITTGGTIEAYCIDIKDDLGKSNAAHTQWGEEFTNGGPTSNQIAYILNTYQLNVPGHDPGAIGDPNQEAAAIQLAVWHFSDSVSISQTSSGPLNAGLVAGIVNRAQAIVNDTNTNATNPQPSAISVSIQGSLMVPTSEQGSVVATVTSPGGAAVNGANVSFTASGGSFNSTSSSTTTSAVTGSNGQASVPVYVNNGGTLSVTASTVSIVAAGSTLVPMDANTQELVLASQTPMTSTASASQPIPTTGVLVVTKTVTDNTSGVTGSNIVSKPGDSLTYTISYNNQGAATLPNFTIGDDFTGTSQNNLGVLKDVSSTSSNATVSGQNYSFAVNNLGAGQTGQVQVSAQIPSGLSGASTDICNTATVSGGSPTGGSSLTACTTVTTTASVVTAKLVDGLSSNTAILGETLRYAISVKNNGTRTLDNVAVSDPMNVNNLGLLTNVTGEAAGATADGVTATVSSSFNSADDSVEGTIPTLDVGQTAVLLFTAQIPSHLTHGVATCFDNIANITSPDVNSETNQVQTCVTPAVCVTVQPQVTISGPLTLVPGLTGTYSVVVTNGGVASMGPTNLTVTFPSDWQIVSTSINTDTSTNVLSFSLGTMAAKATTTVTIVTGPPVTAQVGSTTVTAAVTAGDLSGIADCPPANGQSSATAQTGVVSPGGGVKPVSVPSPTPTPAATSTPAPTATTVPEAVPVPSGAVPVTPETGARDNLIRDLFTGFFLLLAGLIAIIGSLRYRWVYIKNRDL